MSLHTNPSSLRAAWAGYDMDVHVSETCIHKTHADLVVLCGCGEFTTFELNAEQAQDYAYAFPVSGESMASQVRFESLYADADNLTMTLTHDKCQFEMIGLETERCYAFLHFQKKWTGRKQVVASRDSEGVIHQVATNTTDGPPEFTIAAGCGERVRSEDGKPVNVNPFTYDRTPEFEAAMKKLFEHAYEMKPTKIPSSAVNDHDTLYVGMEVLR